MNEWFFGFHAPYLINLDGRPDLRGVFGHVEAWGCTHDGTWLFIDPLGQGLRITAMHEHDEVLDALHARHLVCRTILKLSSDRTFRLPLHGPMTCASICGGLVGVRALVPATLRRKLLRKGAEIVHEAERRPQGQSRPPA